MINRLVFPFLRVLLGCLVLLAIPVRVCAQDSTPTTADLVVTVRDVQGAPIPGLTVQISADADTPVLSETRTNAQGQAVFANIIVSQVRVRVLGTLTSGAQLKQIGADATGVVVFLGPPPTTLDLRVDPDGMVLPDPLTMIDPVPHGPVIATPAPGPDRDGRIVFPTSTTYRSPVAPTVAATSTSPMTSTTPPSPAPLAPPPEAESSAPASDLLNWSVRIIAVLALVVCGLLIRSLARRRV